MQLAILTWILAYLIGSISPIYFIRKQDIQKSVEIIIQIFDFIKGGFPLLLAFYLSLPGYAFYLAAFFTVIGHCFPFYLGFKGGKGFITTLGALATLWIFQVLFNFFTTTLLIVLTLVILTFYICLLFLLTTHYHHKIFLLEQKEKAVNERHEQLQVLAERLEKHEKKKGR